MNLENEMALILVEREFEEPVTFAEVQALEQASGDCFTLRSIEFLHSYFSADRTRMICVYEAADAESVREANRLAELPFSQVWSATKITP